MIKLYCYPYKIGFLATDIEHYCSSLRSTRLSYTDLVVREAIQNSLDAASSECDLDFVEVNFQTGSFEREKLQEVFGNETTDFSTVDKCRNRFLAIRDKNTCGLNGDYWDPRSNYFKLVHGYNNGKTDDNEGAGGSFGLGKTVFCKMGIGIVIYYSRFKKGAEYEERLIVFCAVSTENSPFKADLLPSKIGWWGRKSKNENIPISPLTDPEDIKEILNIFGISAYENQETGTTIIIPFTDESQQLDHIPSQGAEPWSKENRANDQTKDAVLLGRYLEYSVLKWYAPRLMFMRNDLKIDSVYSYGKKLRCTLRIDDMMWQITTEQYPFFAKIRQMYGAAHDSTVPFDNKIEWNNDSENDIKKLEITLSDNIRENIYWEKTPVGVLMLMKSSTSDCIWGDITDVSNNSQAVVLYCRKPGMVIEYNMGDWAKSLNRLCDKQDDKFVGFFIVNSDGEFTYKKDSRKVVAKIESLFRNIEASDHHEWKINSTPTIGNDKLKIAIADRVVGRIKGVISKTMPRDMAPNVAADTISNFLGQYFAAQTNDSGNTKQPGRGSGGGQTSSKQTKIVFKTPEYFWEDGHVIVKVPCKITANPDKQKDITLELGVDVEKARYTKSNWNNNFGEEEFPVKMINLEGKSTKQIDFTILQNQLKIQLQGDKKITLKDLKIVYSISRRDVSCVIMEVKK